MIVCGYAFKRTDDLNISVLQLQAPNHALILSPNDEILETSMDGEFIKTNYKELYLKCSSMSKEGFYQG